ncbi:MAG: diazepam-binding inhibitor receptor modulator, acyl-CoA-binding protein [Actinomycetota bacterium]|nr:diazepam-binding inhibitor receptor modulator, acyl-CoA-binding protein [Actinomycetota bacterium]
MSDLDAQFDAAVADSKTLATAPDQDTMLTMYALFKQAQEGDVTGKRPGFTNPVGRAKYDARAKIAGLDSEQAKADYIALVDSLK